MVLASQRTRGLFRFADCELDLGARELRRAGQPVTVQPKVLELIAYLVVHRDRAVGKAELQDAIWPGVIVTETSLTQAVRKARRALADDAELQNVIRTVHGHGYRFVAPLEAEYARSAVGASETSARTGGAGEGSDPAVSGQAPAGDAAAGDNAAASTAATELSAAQAGAQARPTIAVLPFTNLSGQDEQEYFSDAITQDVISQLSRHRWLNVLGRNATFGYKGATVELRQIARELAADYLVAGSVRRAGERIRVTVELVDVRSGSQRWAERYDRGFEDVFELQDEITATIVARLEPEIGFAERQRVVRAAHADLQAWDSFHLGVAHFFKFTAPDNIEAQRLLQKSRELDPLFGEAHAWWAYAVVLGMVYWDTDPDPDRLEQALAATQRALEIDDQNAIFYALKARVQLARGEYESARRENELAISLNPTLAAAHCGLADTLAYQGHYDEAIRRFEMAIRLSPNDPQRWAFLTYGALALIFKREFEAAIAWTDRAREIPNCQYWTMAHRAVALVYLERSEEAGAALDDVVASCPDFSLAFAERKLFYLKSREQLEMYLEGLRLAGARQC
jgi:TolB-like protein/DNA-binding winged helix-turn-helix (wHTH) protein/Tfp pilus assembly protein PilF